MQSKISLFNGQLISKGLKRFWPLWTIESIIAAIVAFSMVANARIRRSYPDYEYMEIYGTKVMDTAGEWYSLLSGMVPIITIANAILIAMVVWNYLYTAKSAYFFHSLPIKRDTLFGSNFVIGYIMMNIPFLVGTVILSVGTAAFGMFSFRGMLTFILGALGESLLFFGMATFVAHLSGHILALPVLYFVVNFYASIIELMVDVIISGYLRGVPMYYRGVTEPVSPILYLYNNVSYRGTDFYGGTAIAVYSLVGVVLAILAFFIYRRRKSETAGDVIAVKGIKPVLHLAITFAGALGGGYIIYLLFAGFYYNEFNPVGFTVAGVVACVLSYYVLLMLMEKNIRVFSLKTFWPLLACVAVIVGMNVVVSTDAFGIESYIPKENEIKSVEVYINGNSATVEPQKDRELYDAIVASHKVFIENLDSMNGESYVISDYDSKYEEENYSAYYNVDINYFLRNGSEIRRTYSIYTDFTDEENLGPHELAYRALASNPELLIRTLHLNDDYKLTQTFLYVVGKDLNESLDNKDGEALLRAIEKDAKAGCWVPMDFVGKDYGDEIASLDMSFEASYRDGRNTGRTLYDWTYVRVTKEMVNTIEALGDWLD